MAGNECCREERHFGKGSIGVVEMYRVEMIQRGGLGRKSLRIGHAFHRGNVS